MLSLTNYRDINKLYKLSLPVREYAVDSHVSVVPIVGILVLASASSTEDRALNAIWGDPAQVLGELVVAGGHLEGGIGLLLRLRRRGGHG